MGLVYNNFRVLLSAKRQGTSFAKTLTLGRQQVYISRDEVRSLAREFPEFQIDSRSVPAAGEYCEPWLRAWLGCEVVESIDASSYEGATIEHDMNVPIPHQWEAQFSAVIDGGSIEHIYFVTVAIANAMLLTQVGGTLFIASVASNHCGHGFYQLSPEWFFRTLSTENGFEIGDVLLMPHPYPGAELSSNRRLYRVLDPAKYGARVGLVHPRPVLVLASARRIEVCELFRRPPQQSDYVGKWDTASNSVQASPPMNTRKRPTVHRVVGAIGRHLHRSLPRSVQQRIHGKNQLRDYALSNHRVFELWDPPPVPLQ